MKFFLDRQERRSASLKERREVLRSRNVPERYVERVATRRESVLGFAGGVAVLPLFLASLWAWWKAFEWSLPGPWIRLTRIAQEAGAWLYGGDHLFWLNPAAWIGMLFVVIMLAGALLSLPALRVPPHPKPSLAASMLRSRTSGDGAVATEWMFRRTVAAAAGARDCDDFLRRTARYQITIWTVATLSLGTLAAIAMLVGADSYWTAGAAGLLRHDIYGSRLYHWREATSLEVRCELQREQQALVYSVQVGGEAIDLGSAGSASEGISLPQRLAGLQLVDAELRSRDIPRHSHAEPACVAYWARVGGPRIGALLEDAGLK